MQVNNRNLLNRFFIWRTRHISQEQFILILSVIVGFVTGLAAVFLKYSTHLIQEFVSSGHLTKLYNPYYFVFPIVGILITVLIKKMFKSKVGEGIPSALYAISRKGGYLSPSKMYSSIVTSIFTVGFGGSVGLEGPTISTGSAIGSNLGRMMHIDYKSRILLMGCASAGALASIYNAPLAAIIFTIEILSLDLTMRSMIPLLLSSAAGALTSILMQGNDYMLHYAHDMPLVLKDIPFYVLLGIGTAFVSVYFTAIYEYTERKFEKFKNWYTKVLIGGSVLGLIIFLLPTLYGEGYEIVNLLLDGDFSSITEVGPFKNLASSTSILLILLAIVLFKPIATSVTLKAGGVGGLFAPSIFLGAIFGFLFSGTINTLGWVELSSGNFALAGMAGLLAGLLHAPLTAIFMIAELTGGYQLFLPLMIVSAISYAISKHIKPYSIYTHQLAKRGDLITHDKDHAVLTLLDTRKVIESDFKIVRPGMTLRQLIRIVSTSHRNLFPVVDTNKKLVGVLTLDDFRTIMFDESLYDIIIVAEIMNQPPDTINLEDNMSVVTQKFQKSGAWNLPVVDNGKYIGFISKSKLFSAYRRKLIEFTG
ncbi:MAG: chloride channel protein [Balneolaceae bacterium]